MNWQLWFGIVLLGAVSLGFVGTFTYMVFSEAAGGMCCCSGPVPRHPERGVRRDLVGRGGSVMIFSSTKRLLAQPEVGRG